MYFLYTLLQSLDCDADLDDLDSIDKLRVVGVEVATQMVDKHTPATDKLHYYAVIPSQVQWLNMPI